MKTGLINLFTCSVAALALAGTAAAGNIDIAKSWYEHQLFDKAKEALITALHDQQTSDADKADALYLLGNMSFEEKRYKTAFADWEQLVKRFPESPQSKEIAARLAQLRELNAQNIDNKVSSATAALYLRNGDFWSHSDHKFAIDSSWLNQVELAVQWYDRTISEFPDTYAAEVSYEKKLFALLGWRELGRDGESHGLKQDFERYMPLVIETFSKFETSFPNNSSLQGFRYQIAQAYWSKKRWMQTRQWLEKIIDSSKGEKTFFTETAKARLQKIEF